MKNVKTIAVKATDLKVGNIVQFYNARFEILETNIINQNDSPTMTTKAKWLDGEEIRGYFGKGTIDWNFQGNDLAYFAVE